MINFLKEYLKNKSVCIVGPAPLQKDMSKIIDSCDVVIRMNDYTKILGGNYGTKTDMVFSCFHDTGIKIEEKLTNDVSVVVLPYISKDTYKHHPDFFKNNNFSIMEKTRNIYPNKVYLTIDDDNDFAFYDNITKNKKGIYTTGGITCCILIEMIEFINELKIIGLSLYSGHMNKEYYNNKYYEHVNKYDKSLYMNNNFLNLKFGIETRHLYEEDRKFFCDLIKKHANNYYKITIDDSNLKKMVEEYIE